LQIGAGFYVTQVLEQIARPQVCGTGFGGGGRDRYEAIGDDGLGGDTEEDADQGDDARAHGSTFREMARKWDEGQM
jgi:hypothetical protein